MWLQSCDADKIVKKLNYQKQKGRQPSKAFLVKDVGLFVAGKNSELEVIKDITVSSFFIRSCAHAMGGINTLNKRQQEFIGYLKV